MAKNSFIVHFDYEPLIEELPNEDKGLLLLAMFAYAKGEQIPDLKPLTKMAFKFIKRQMDYDLQKWNKTCEKRAIAGAKGGKQKVANASNCKQKVANVADKENVNDKDKENVNVKESPILSEWNSLASRAEISPVKTINADRSKKVKQREKEGFCLEERKEVFKKIEESSFLTGKREGSDWKVTFDWLFGNGSNWVKVLEGNYDDKKPKAKPIHINYTDMTNTGGE